MEFDVMLYMAAGIKNRVLLDLNVMNIITF